MNKGFAVPIALILLLSSGAFAAIGQTQHFNIDASNVGSMTGAGGGGAASMALVPVAHSQVAVDRSGGVIALQTGIGLLVQGASAVGLGGLHGFEQSASAVGDQSQAVPDPYTLGLQEQNLGADLSQDAFTVGGLGSAVALQSFVGAQHQFIVTPYGVSVNVQCVGVSLLDGIGGRNSSVLNRGLNIERTMFR